MTRARPGSGGAGDDQPARSPERSSEDRSLFERYLDRRDPVDRETLVERFLPLPRQLARRSPRPRGRRCAGGAFLAPPPPPAPPLPAPRGAVRRPLPGRVPGPGEG